MAAMLAAALCAAAAGPAAAATTSVGSLSPDPISAVCSPSTWVPLAVAPGGPSYEVPPGYGVITSWEARVGSWATTSKLKVLRRLSPTIFNVVASSDPQAMPSSGTPVVYSYPVRFPVQPGDLVGLQVSGPGLLSCSYTSAGSQIQWTGTGTDPSPGETATLAGSPAENVLLSVRATVETDADADGFGDDTQDQCPAGATTQAACPDAPAPAPDARAPTLSNATFKPKRFRASRKASAAKARKKRKKAPRGSTLRYGLSEAAAVTVAIERTMRGQRVKGKCRKRKPVHRRKAHRAKTQQKEKGKRCTLRRTVGSLAQEGLAGANARPFSGLVGSRALKRGTYIATLTAKDAAGNASQSASAKFTILRR